jgi:pimeloyl-ACP methyl ester carboxylesterase
MEKDGSERSPGHPMASFFTAGVKIPHKESYIIINQSYVGFRPACPPPPSEASPTPILFVHGGGLTGAMWEATPDRRPGWAADANALGYHSYILDTVDLGRSQRAPDACRTGDVEHRTARYVWERFRIGSSSDFEKRMPFPGSQFPVEHFDALVAAQAARRRNTDDVETRGVVRAIRELGQCHVVAHSHGAALVLDALEELVPFLKKLVLVEPGETARPDLLQQHIPTLIVWGDYLDAHPVWPKITLGYEQSPVDILNLPKANIKGNSHFPMLEQNSSLIFGMIMDWLNSSK